MLYITARNNHKYSKYLEKEKERKGKHPFHLGSSQKQIGTPTHTAWLCILQSQSTATKGPGFFGTAARRHTQASRKRACTPQRSGLTCSLELLTSVGKLHWQVLTRERQLLFQTCVSERQPFTLTVSLKKKKGWWPLLCCKCIFSMWILRYWASGKNGSPENH